MSCISGWCPILLVVLSVVLTTNGFIVNPGPKFIATRGHPWPLPNKWTQTKNSFFGVDPSKLEISTGTGYNCLIIRNASERYSKIIYEMAPSDQKTRGIAENDVNYQVILASPLINLTRFLITESA